MLNVAVALNMDAEQWLGGLNYFRSLSFAVNNYSAGRLKLRFYTATPEAFSSFTGPFVEVCATRAMNWRSGPSAFVSRVCKKAGLYDLGLLRKLRRDRIDLISHFSIGRQRHIPTLPWVPDFQHRALPELFERSESRQRERAVAESRYFGCLLLSSEAARSDFESHFSFQAAVRVYVARFAAMRVETVPSAATQIRQKYDLPEDYFYVPNHFWVHKNHELLIRALALLGPSVCIVCSGNTSDRRRAGHFAELKALAGDLRVADRFRVLGVIPYVDVAALMREAVAVVNPSRFEGWSTSVEEAKALGMPIVASGIPVHVEQTKGLNDVHLFDESSPAALADALHSAGAEPRVRVSEAELAAAHALRTEQFFEAYLCAVTAAAA